MKRFAKKLPILLALVFVLQMCLAGFSFAVDYQIATNATEARKAVVPIYLVYKDKNNVEHYLKGGSAFFIDSDTILTCNHVGQIEDSEVADYAYACGVSEEDMLKARTNSQSVYCLVILDRDVKVKAVIKDANSAAYDFAAFNVQSENGLKNRMVLALGKDSMVQDLTSVSVLGFPSIANTTNSADINTSSDVTITSGKVSKFETVSGTKYFVHDAVTTYGNSGGPVISEQGYVIGISAQVFSDNNANYSYALCMDSICSLLDTFNIHYEIDNGNQGGGSTAEPTTESTSAEGCAHEWTQTSVNGCITTSTCSKCGETKTENNGNHLYGEWQETKAATAKEAGMKSRTCTTCGDVQKEEIPATGGNSNMIVIIAAAAAAVILIIIIIVVVSSKGKKKAVAPAAAPPIPTPVASGRPPMPPMTPSMPSGGTEVGATTVLDQGGGETTVLGGNSAARATLVRTKNGERISVSGNEFVIGKERRRVNYCIDNNSISRTHAKLICRSGEYFITDMNSTNFTYVNGERLAAGQEKALKAGDTIKLADEEFEFKG